MLQPATGGGDVGDGGVIAPDRVLAVGSESGASSGESDLARAVRRGSSQGVTDVGQQAVGAAWRLRRP